MATLRSQVSPVSLPALTPISGNQKVGTHLLAPPWPKPCSSLSWSTGFVSVSTTKSNSLSKGMEGSLCFTIFRITQALCYLKQRCLGACRSFPITFAALAPLLSVAFD